MKLEPNQFLIKMKLRKDQIYGWTLNKLIILLWTRLSSPLFRLISLKSGRINFVCAFAHAFQIAVVAFTLNIFIIDAFASENLNDRADRNFQFSVINFDLDDP